jgi:hypothetical protein
MTLSTHLLEHVELVLLLGVLGRAYRHAGKKTTKGLNRRKQLELVKRRDVWE